MPVMTEPASRISVQEAGTLTMKAPGPQAWRQLWETESSVPCCVRDGVGLQAFEILGPIFYPVGDAVEAGDVGQAFKFHTVKNDSCICTSSFSLPHLPVIFIKKQSEAFCLNHLPHCRATVFNTHNL